MFVFYLITHVWFSLQRSFDLNTNTVCMKLSKFELYFFKIKSKKKLSYTSTSRRFKMHVNNSICYVIIAILDDFPVLKHVYKYL